MEIQGTMSQSYYDIRKLRRSMSNPPQDVEYDRRDDRGREERRPYDPYRSRPSRSRSPVRSEQEKYKSYQSRMEEDRPQSKDSSSSYEKRSREKSPPKETGSRSKQKVPATKRPRTDKETTESSSGRDTELTILAPPPPDAGTAIKRAYLKEQFPEHYFETLTFLPALEPISSDWAEEAKAKIDAVQKQYTEMFKYSRNLSRIIRTLITNTDSMQKTAEEDTKALKALGKDLEDTQAQLAVAQKDASNFKQQFEDMQKRYHDLLESHTQERSELKKQADEAKSEATKTRLAYAELEQKNAELAKRSAELEKKNADLASKLLEAENRAALAEGNVECAIKSAEEARKQLSEAEADIQGFGELMIEFFAHIIHRRNISWIEDYPSTLVQVWNQIVEWEKEELKVDSLDEDKLMEKYLRDDEPERLAEGRRLIAEAMEEERQKSKQKTTLKAGSSSSAPATPEVEGYDPENPGIPQTTLLSPIPEITPEVVVTPAENSSEGVESSEKTDVAQGATAGTKPADGAKKGEDKAASTDLGEGNEPTKVTTPHDEEIIAALKDDGGDGEHDKEPEVAITGESKSTDDVTLAAMKADQDKRLQLKAEELDPEVLKPLAVMDAGSSVPPSGKKSTGSSTASSGKKKSKRILTEAEKEAKDAEKAAKKSKAHSKPK